MLHTSMVLSFVSFFLCRLVQWLEWNRANIDTVKENSENEQIDQKGLAGWMS